MLKMKNISSEMKQSLDRIKSVSDTEALRLSIPIISALAIHYIKLHILYKTTIQYRKQA